MQVIAFSDFANYAEAPPCPGPVYVIMMAADIVATK